uniref:CSON002732 protein n=1 Tax=Culicoides sonorensis TaxID=179676 RepID=A0A336KH69_CULSO
MAKTIFIKIENISKIPEHQYLPTNGQVLGLLYGIREKTNLRKKAIKVSEILLLHYKKKKIDINVTKNRTVQKVRDLLDKYILIQKQFKSNSAIARKREHEFFINLRKPFSVGSIDPINARKQKIKQLKNKENIETQQQPEQQKYNSESEYSIYEDESDQEESDEEESEPVSKRPKLNADKLLGFDYSRTNNYNAVINLNSEEKGKNSAFKYSTSTVKNQRKKARNEKTSQILNEAAAMTGPIGLSFDGKALVDIDKKDKSRHERIVILLTGLNKEKLIGVKKVSPGTGVNVGNNIVAVCREIGVKKLQYCNYDTCSVNTGSTKGALSTIESQMEGSFLHLSCRHHVYELPLGSCVEYYLGKSTGPEVHEFEFSPEDIRSRPLKGKNSFFFLTIPGCHPSIVKILLIHLKLKISSARF